MRAPEALFNPHTPPTCFPCCLLFSEPFPLCPLEPLFDEKQITLHPGFLNCASPSIPCLHWTEALSCGLLLKEIAASLIPWMPKIGRGRWRKLSPFTPLWSSPVMNNISFPLRVMASGCITLYTTLNYHSRSKDRKRAAEWEDCRLALSQEYKQVTITSS